MPILTSWTEMSLSQVGFTTLLSFFIIRPMMNWNQYQAIVKRMKRLTSSTKAVLYSPKKTLPRIAFSHLVGIGSCSASMVLTRSCMSS